jgi:hypothetical protein
MNEIFYLDGIFEPLNEALAEFGISFMADVDDKSFC